MKKRVLAEFVRALHDERGSQTVKSTIGVLFFFVFIGSGMAINYSSLPLSYNIAFGSSDSTGGGSGSGAGGGGGGGSEIANCGAGNYSYVFSPKMKAKIDAMRVSVRYEMGSTTKSGGEISNNARIGTAEWRMVENATKEDGVYASAEIPFCHTSQYLQGNALKLNVPDTAKIIGIMLKIKRSADGPDAVRDYSVRIIKNGEPAGEDRRDLSTWPSNNTWNTYGSEKDGWGVTLTGKDVNDPKFGFAIAVYNGPVSAMIAQPTIQIPTKQPTVQVIVEKPKQIDTITPKAPAPTIIPPSQQPTTQPVIPIYTPPQTDQGANAIALASLFIPLGMGDAGPAVTALQKLLIRWSIGNAGAVLAQSGATGIYGWRTSQAVDALQKMLIRNPKGPAAQKLKKALESGDTPGRMGPATKAAWIELMISL